MKTQHNLATAFAGESQANRKYLMFAEKAAQEGHKGVARLFKAAAAAEQLHAFAEFRALGGIKTTAENLEAAKAGETYEFTEMYPPMIETAKDEGEKVAERTFTLANAAEKVHAELYADALVNIDNDEVYYLCPVCGYIHKGKPSGNCPICGVLTDKFVEFAD